ncbi:hypothetical protein [Streptomyces violascens]|uniref:Uncharacterized protein n=1 Tax=Streptomyces violascens TaxID=67381 RepID=A0ABQ3QXT9_9ACTN|nr:hypothetical protein [Streptomyces violascens]GGU18199.1 hypothetical protein GCM10010289_44810 [Streptomyces violascens]GHI42073.1 hypothetical protein Sviol_64810 [Streptomyces violascens]
MVQPDRAMTTVAASASPYAVLGDSPGDAGRIAGPDAVVAAFRPGHRDGDQQITHREMDGTGDAYEDGTYICRADAPLHAKLVERVLDGGGLLAGSALVPWCHLA